MLKVDEIQTEVTKQIEGKNTSIWTCPQCGSSNNTQYFLQLIYSGRKDAYFPTFIPQIKEVCSVCGRYRRFVKQTEMLVTRFNERLEKIPVISQGFRDFERR